jgi:hypothetical protein
MKSKSAVEFLVETLAENGILHSSDIEKAKEMEKQQMWNYIESNYVNGENSLAFHKAEFEQYYNETFKQ